MKSELPPRAFTTSEAAIYIGMSESWLRHARVEGPREGKIPTLKFIKIGRTVRYLKEDLDSWLDQFQKLDHLSQPFLHPIHGDIYKPEK
jgi:predicted DNA-binding transcriptional regulator AlpA